MLAVVKNLFISVFTYAFKSDITITKVIYFAIASAVTAFLVKKLLSMTSKSWGFDDDDSDTDDDQVDETVGRAVSIVREGEPYKLLNSEKVLLSGYNGKVEAHNEADDMYEKYD
jgi:type IV secretory pathway TrbF-like protein